MRWLLLILLGSLVLLLGGCAGTTVDPGVTGEVTQVDTSTERGLPDPEYGLAVPDGIDLDISEYGLGTVPSAGEVGAGEVISIPPECRVVADEMIGLVEEAGNSEGVLSEEMISEMRTKLGVRVLQLQGAGCKDGGVAYVTAAVEAMDGGAEVEWALAYLADA